MKKLFIISLLVVAFVLSGCEAEPERDGKYYFSENKAQSERYEAWEKWDLESWSSSLPQSRVFKNEEKIGEPNGFIRISSDEAKTIRAYVEHLMHYFYDYGRVNYTQEITESKDLIAPALLEALLNGKVLQQRREAIEEYGVSTVISNADIMAGNCVKQFTGAEGQNIYRVASSMFIDTFTDDDEFYVNNPCFVPGSGLFDAYFYIDASDLDNLVLLQWEEYIMTEGGGQITVSYTPQGIDKEERLKDEPAACSYYTPEQAGVEIMQADYVGEYSFDNDTAWDIYAFVYTFLDTVFDLGDGNRENYDQSIQEYMSAECISNAAYNQNYLKYPADVIGENASLRIQVYPSFMLPGFFPHRNDNSVYEFSKNGKTIYAVKASFKAELKDEAQKVSFPVLPVSSVGTWEYDAWVFFSIAESQIRIEAFKVGLNSNSGTFEYTLDSLKADEELHELGYELGDIKKKD